MHDQVSESCSRLTTKAYSTSFSLGILFLHKKLRGAIYSIYGFVRFADEIVDTFHGHDKERLLRDFKRDTYQALEDGISLNPILHSFQQVVHQYNIRSEWIDTFMASMEMDLDKTTYSTDKYDQYILGSAEVVGLMCLHVFTGGDDAMFDKLKPLAMRLGAAFQKVNFLRDVKADKEDLGRTYFPGVDLGRFSSEDKKKIEQDIEEDFREGLKGIKQLPKSSRCGVYLAYYYYTRLFRKIKRLPPQRILEERIRIPNFEKLILMIKSRLRYQLNLIR
jgi:phytoene/squalene synthetase